MPDRFDSSVTTTCGYCGVGCRFEAHARNGRVASISSALDGPANQGHTSTNEDCDVCHSPDVRPIPEEATMTPALAEA